MQLIVLTVLSVFSFLLLLLTSPVLNTKTRKYKNYSLNTSKLKHVLKRNENVMCSEPEDTKNKVYTCPNLNDYIHKSKLKENTVLHTNPYILKISSKTNTNSNNTINEETRVEEMDLDSDIIKFSEPSEPSERFKSIERIKYPECPKCPECPKSSIYKEKMEWIPIVKSECDI